MVLGPQDRLEANRRSEETLISCSDHHGGSTREVTIMLGGSVLTATWQLSPLGQDAKVAFSKEVSSLRGISHHTPGRIMGLILIIQLQQKHLSHNTSNIIKIDYQSQSGSSHNL